MKRFIILVLTLFSVFILLFLFRFEEVTDYQFAKCYYTGIQYGQRDDPTGPRPKWVDDHNLTETAKLFSGVDHRAASRTIKTMEEYDAFVDRIETKIDGVIAAIGDYEHLHVGEDHLEHTIDEAFFEDYNILVIDFCGINVANQLTTLTHIRRNDLFDMTVATVEYTIYDGSAEDLLGELYWIAVPKEYGEVKVIYKEVKPKVMKNDLGGL